MQYANGMAALLPHRRGVAQQIGQVDGHEFEPEVIGAESRQVEQVRDNSLHAHRLCVDGGAGRLRSTGHLEIVRQTKRRGAVTILVQRGEITALSAASISLKSKDGFAHTYVIGAKTKVRERREPVAIADLKVGERAMVIARRTDAGDVVQRVSCGGLK